MTLLRRVIGEALRRARRGQGKTLRDVAEAARVSVQYLSELERGRKEASSEVLAAVCGALGWTLLDLLDEVRSDLAASPVIPLHTPSDVPVPGRAPAPAPMRVPAGFGARRAAAELSEGRERSEGREGSEGRERVQSHGVAAAPAGRPTGTVRLAA